MNQLFVSKMEYNSRVLLSKRCALTAEHTVYFRYKYTFSLIPSIKLIFYSLTIHFRLHYLRKIEQKDFLAIEMRATLGQVRFYCKI